MIKKIILGGILAGLLMFAWSSLAHTVLPIGAMGISTTPNEDAVLNALKSNLSSPGFYMIPGHQLFEAEKTGGDSQKAMTEWQTKYGGGAWAVLIYHPAGATVMEVRQLVCEFVADLVAGLIMAFALWMALARVLTFFGRVLFIALIGVLPWLIVDVSNMNWYGFPTSYGIGQLLDQGVGAILAGIALALLYRRE